MTATNVLTAAPICRVCHELGDPSALVRVRPRDGSAPWYAHRPRGDGWPRCWGRVPSRDVATIEAVEPEVVR